MSPFVSHFCTFPQLEHAPLDHYHAVDGEDETDLLRDLVAAHSCTPRPIDHEQVVGVQQCVQLMGCASNVRSGQI